MKKITGLFLLIAFAYNAGAQSWAYSLASIPEAIKNKASVIIHLENIDVEVEDIDKVNYSVHKIFTVMNEEGKRDLFIYQHTSKYVSLDDMEIKVYDANGKQTGKYKKKDMTTMASGEGLIEDGYASYYNITTSSYPVTVDIKYQLKYKTTLFIPDFRFISPKEGVVESNYTAKVPATMPLRYKQEHCTIQPVVSQFGQYMTYKWSVKNLSPLESEEGSASDYDKYPHVKIVSDKFSHYGFTGDFSSWKSFGTWIRDLYQGLEVLPPDRQQFFKSLVQNAGSETEKIKKIYAYLQENFRYVSIQLGIGGFRPFSADFTDKKKYGDCKALSNFMKAALGSVGIKSYVAVINAGFDGEAVDPTFPEQGFNHVILCVPRPKDSIWLECTSSTAAFGELGTFTENRNALLITEDGGALVPTPKSRSSYNIFSTTTNVTVDEDQSALSETIFTTKGSYREMLNDILKDKRDDQKEAIVSYLGFKQPDDFLLLRDDSSGENTVKLKMAISKLPEFNAGNKLFISPHIYKILTKALPKADNRKLDYYFRNPFEKTDTTVFKLTPAMKPDVLPAEKELKCAYAFFKSKCWYNDKENAIYSTTSLILKNHKIPASDYAQVKTFFDNVIQEDAQKIIIKHTETEKKAF